jgi:hypothetical protein
MMISSFAEALRKVDESRVGSYFAQKNFLMIIVKKLSAEDEGFKPPIPKKGIPDFESSAFGHSANLPYCIAKLLLFS